MNIKIKNEEYTIYVTDTVDTVTNKVALNLQLLPRYVKITTFMPDNGNIKIKVLDDELKKLTIPKLQESLQKIAQDWSIDYREIVLRWLYLHPKNFTKFNLQVIDILHEIDSTDFYNYDTTKKSLDVYNQQLARSLKNLEQDVVNVNKYGQEIDKINGVDTTDFIQDANIVEYKFTVDFDPLEAFDSIVLTDQIAFAQLNTSGTMYYKLLDFVEPQDDWLTSSATIVLKIKNEQKWDTVTIVYTEDEQPYNIVMTISVDLKTREKKILNTILSVFNGATFNETGRAEKGKKGVFAVPDIIINRDVILDLITNNLMVSHFFYVDETSDLSSQKTALYIHYTTENNPVTVVLSERRVTRGDRFHKAGLLELGTMYLNVRVTRANTLEQVDRFKQAFAIMLAVYNKKYASIVKKYKDLIPEFKAEKSRKQITETRLNKLQAMDSKLFVEGYAKSCAQKVQPLPIQEDEVQDWEEDGYQVMNYPSDSNNYFVCPDDPTYYPGLRPNKLENKDKYTYLPCCFKEDQSVGNKKWAQYLQGVTKEKRSKASNIVSQKVATENKIGYLPRNIYLLLDKTRTEEEQFLRLGVPISKNSFIEVVALALSQEYAETPADSRAKFISDLRTNLASVELTAVAQQLYNKTPAQITADILNPDIVFDSKYYVKILEDYFDCQIVLFARNNKYPNGSFEIPNYTQGYLYNKIDPTKKTVLVYKHYGITGDRMETPHYELIVSTVGRKLQQLYFTKEDSALIRNIYAYFLKSYRLYIIGHDRYTPPPPLHFTEISGQIIDRYGKTRGVMYKNNVHLIVSPAPAIYGIQRVEIPQRPNYSSVNSFIKKNKLKIIAQDVEDEKTVGFSLDVPGYSYVYAPCKPVEPLPGIPIGNNLGFSAPSNKDILETTIINRKIADFMMQYILYRFSLFYIETISDPEYEEEFSDKLSQKIVEKKEYILELVDYFLQKYVLVIKNHDYQVVGKNKISRRLSMNNSFFKDEKLIVDSKKTLQRIGYYLRFKIITDIRVVDEYSKKVYLDNYYTYASDFKQHEAQLVFIGNLSIENWIASLRSGIRNMVHTIPQPEFTEPYFFSHWAINAGKAVIIQNVANGSIERAYSVAQQFVDREINMGYDATPMQLGAYSQYYLLDGVMYRDGIAPVSIFKYTDGIYAAIIFPA